MRGRRRYLCPRCGLFDDEHRFVACDDVDWIVVVSDDPVPLYERILCWIGERDGWFVPPILGIMTIRYGLLAGTLTLACVSVAILGTHVREREVK